MHTLVILVLEPAIFVGFAPVGVEKQTWCDGDTGVANESCNDDLWALEAFEKVDVGADWFEVFEYASGSFSLRIDDVIAIAVFEFDLLGKATGVGFDVDFLEWSFVGTVIFISDKEDHQKRVITKETAIVVGVIQFVGRECEAHGFEWFFDGRALHTDLDGRSKLSFEDGLWDFTGFDEAALFVHADKCPEWCVWLCVCGDDANVKISDIGFLEFVDKELEVGGEFVLFFFHGVGVVDHEQKVDFGWCGLGDVDLLPFGEILACPADTVSSDTATFVIGAIAVFVAVDWTKRRYFGTDACVLLASLSGRTVIIVEALGDFVN